MIAKFRADSSAVRCPVRLVEKRYVFTMTTSVDPVSLRRGSDLRAAVAEQIMAEKRLGRLTGELVEEVARLRSVQVAADTLIARAEVEATVVTPRQGETLLVGPGCKWRALSATRLQLVGRLHRGTIELTVNLPDGVTVVDVSSPMKQVRVTVQGVHHFDGVFRVEALVDEVLTSVD